ncbi:helix-turn-helix domain-containing protein [Polymorphobacter sp. PAMC 29334]|uniref:AraC family transcriptional regulator n=1 Tax=Polymorphobacter sp. PAMC 29334 TaxID=2862331 RepID=UPI001C76BC15|nr:helix-turn-helix domain-containing protein [Polymorphobacter sp. PAMC 29334]QYE34455.1 helix-turn-helix domain-containing protein [Polymorphobacter sp. PAMC 29334]
MIASGSHAPGIRAADFGLPAGTAMRIERAADALRPVLSSYTVLDSDEALWSGASNWLLPGWAKIWIGLAANSLDVKVGSRHYPQLGPAMLFGVTSRAMPATTYGGVSIVIDVGPLAWARLFALSAESLRDRITPLAVLVPPGWSEDLVARIARSDRGADIKFVIDDFFHERLPPPHKSEATLARIIALLGDEATHDLSKAAVQVGIDDRLLRQLAKRYFGFPPKLLSMRTRFLRALTELLVDQGEPDFAATPKGYHDNSHFIRDANRFLGMTPRRFLALDLPVTRAAARARALVMGAATSSLDSVIE